MRVKFETSKLQHRTKATYQDDETFGIPLHRSHCHVYGYDVHTARRSLYGRQPMLPWLPLQSVGRSLHRRRTRRTKWSMATRIRIIMMTMPLTPELRFINKYLM